MISEHDQQWWLKKADELLMSMIEFRGKLGDASKEERSRLLQEHCAAWLMANFAEKGR